jgi:hypothetical protein
VLQADLKVTPSRGVSKIKSHEVHRDRANRGQLKGCLNSPGADCGYAERGLGSDRRNSATGDSQTPKTNMYSLLGSTWAGTCV